MIPGSLVDRRKITALQVQEEDCPLAAFRCAIDINGIAEWHHYRIYARPHSPGGTYAFHYPKRYRTEVLARALECYAGQLESGLNENDFAGRNVMLVTLPPTNVTDARARKLVGRISMPRVVLIDYNIAWITSPGSESGPVHPSELGQGLDLWEQFGCWVSNDWEEWHERELETGTNRLEMEWIRSRFPRTGRTQSGLVVDEPTVEGFSPSSQEYTRGVWCKARKQSSRGPCPIC